MRQKKDDRGALTPFLLRAADELVDDGLGTIEEVAELGLPEHQCVRSLDRIAVLEAHRGILREQRVVDPEAGLALTEVEQGGPSRSSEPKASSSPVAQSMPPSRVLAARFSSIVMSLG